jgi:WD40 repeat protein
LTSVGGDAILLRDHQSDTMPPEPAGTPRLYTAFLSYSHAADGRLAPAIQSSLHKFAKPWYRPRALRIFRDKTSLSATPALWPSIERALESSEWFLLLASPDAAASPWVGKEIEWWLGHRPPAKMLLVLTSGELVWKTAESDFDWTRTTAVPPLLSGRIRDEPLYVDLRWAKRSEELSLRHTQFRAAMLDLASPLHGRPKDELDGEDVRQHRRTRRLAWGAAGLLAALTVASVLAAFVAVAQRRVAVRQTQIAVSRLLAVESNRMLSEDMGVALLLAAAADQSAPTTEARAALRSAFQQSPRLRRLLGPARERVLGVAASRSPHALLSIGANGTLTGWSGDTGSVLSSARVVEQRVTAAAFSADARALAAGTADGAIVIVDRASGRTIHAATSHRAAVAILGFSRDGLTLVSAGRDGAVAVWDAATGRRKDRGRIGAGRVVSIALSPDGTSVAANLAGPGPARVVVAAVTGDGPPGEVGRASARSDVVFGPDGTTVAFGDDDEQIVIWDVVRRRRRHLLRGPDTWISCLAISPDGTRVVAGQGTGAVLLWQLPNETQPSPLQEHRQIVSEVAFSPDGARIASRAEQQVMIHSLDEPRRSVVLLGHRAKVTSMAFQPEGDGLVTGDDTGRVLVWGLSAGAQFEAVAIGDGSLGDGMVHSVAFHPDGTTLAVGGGRGATTLWDVARGRRVRVIDGHASNVLSVSFSPDGRTLATASLDHTVKLRDVATGAVLGDWPGHEGRTVTVAFRPDGKVLAAQRDRDSIGFWDVERRTEGPLLRLGGASSEILSLAYRGDGSLLAVGRDDGRITLTTGAGDREIRTFEDRHGGVVSVAFSPDGRRLASGSRDGTIVFRDVESGSSGLVLRHPPFAVASLAFTPDGRRLASGTGDGKVVLWDLATGQPAVVLEGHEAEVVSLSVSRDGARLASGSWDGKVQIWDARLDEWYRRACEIANRQLTPAEWTAHAGSEVPYRAACPS